MRLHLSFAGVLGVVILAGAAGRAASAGTIDLYHLGEADPGAVAGNPGDAFTVDSGPGATNLPVLGSPTYSSNVGAPGSTISMSFNGSTDGYVLNHVLTTLTTGVGMSAWIYPTVNNSIAPIAYNGNSGANGFGLYQFNGGAGTASIIGLVGGVDLGPSVSIPLNTWTEVTQFLSGGQDMLYVNGVFVTSKADVANTPNGIFDIGGHLSEDGNPGEFFQGNVDEVSLITAPFPAPEPSSLAALGGLAAIGLLVIARRRGKA